MASKINDLVRAVNDEIAPLAYNITSERKRKELRRMLLGLERMSKQIKKELMAETRMAKANRQRDRKQKQKQDIEDMTIQEE